MSIFNRLTGRHLDDAALAAIWTANADRSSEVITDSHLEQCDECRVRFAAFAQWMQDVRNDAVAEADDVFSPARLAAQQAQIMKRIETAERPARIIAFPKHPADAVMRPSTLHRWVAVAAAAGLIVGLGVGQLMDLRHIGEPRALSIESAAGQPAIEESGRGIVQAGASVTEEMLLQELEAAATPRYEALRAFDTFTPRAADYVTSSR